MSNELGGAGIKRKRGRPRKESRYVERYNLWLNEEEVDILNEISFEDDMNRADILRKALHTYDTIRKNRVKFR